MAKATDAEIQLRIAILYEMIVKGCSREYIVRYSSEKWNIGDRQVDDYLKLVRNKIQNTYGQEYRETILNNHLAQLENLYAKNYIIEDFRECRSIIESRNKLLGLNEATKIEISEKPIFKQIDLDVTSDDSSI
jgi:hypothetical protein